MKNIIIALLVFATIALAFTCVYARLEAKEETKNLYAKNSVCIKVDNETDEVFFETDNGHIFSIYGIEDWCENDTCIIIFNSQGTMQVADDEIVKITYTNWVTE